MRRMMTWIVLGFLALGLTACGGDSPPASDTDRPVAEAVQAVATPSSPDPSSGVMTCGRIGIGNYMVNFLECTDSDLRSMSCKQAGKDGYECACKLGPMGSQEVLDTVMIEGRKPFERVDDIPTIHANATAAALEICGFEIRHPCDGTS